MIKKIFISSLTCVGLLASCARADEPTHATICAIVAKPEQFLDGELKVRAIWSVHYHGVLLQDDNCPRVGISIQLPEKIEPRSGINKFLDLAYGEPDNDSGRRLGPDTFIGTLRIQKNPIEVPYLILDLRSFSSP
jgi:hypothetical protein